MKSIVAAALLALGAPAAAPAQQPQPLKVSEGAAYKHKPSRLQLPATLLGIPRSKAVAYEEPVDVSAEYATADQSEIYTVYIFRRVAADLPVWFDRALWAIESRDVYGTPTLLERNAAFVPPRQSNASALFASYDLAGSQFRSTSVAIVPLGEWLVKVRASAKSMTAAELETRIKQAVAELPWPKQIAAAPDAAPVPVCTSRLIIGEEGKRLPDDVGANLLGALLGAVVEEPERGKKRQAERRVSWCRNSADRGEGIYRADEETDGYLITIGDAGRAIRAAPSVASQILAQAGDGQDAQRRWSVTLLLLQEQLVSGTYDALPPPAQARQIVQSNQFVTRRPTWGKAKGTINIDPGSVR